VELDGETNRLYGLPLDEFVRERDEVAKRLRREGEREAAEEIKKLRKPSAGAWALNQAIRRRRRETDALLAAGERLRAAHEALLAGGDPAALREAMQEERALGSAMADCAEAIASETGKSGPALRERVRATLHAATVDEEAREELATGRFVREREAVGLGPFSAGAGPAADAAAAVAPRGRGGRTRKGAASARAKRSAPARDDAAAREEAAARERAERLAAAERALADAHGALEEAEASHSEAAGELQAAREALEAVEAREREARDAARELRREAAKRERELERLRARKR
jgi:hypothetical protein